MPCIFFAQCLCSLATTQCLRTLATLSLASSLTLINADDRTSLTAQEKYVGAAFRLLPLTEKAGYRAVK